MFIHVYLYSKVCLISAQLFGLSLEIIDMGKNVEYAPKSQLSPQWVSEMVVLALNTTLL